MNSIRLYKVICAITFTLLATTVLANQPDTLTNNKSTAHLTLLSLQPGNNNVKYAVFVSGNQPLSQSWHNQVVNAKYAPAFELGFNYGFDPSFYNMSIDWLHFNSSDSRTKQASENTDPTTVEFVAPSYDVGPAVFGIKRAKGTVDYDLNSIFLNIGKNYDYNANLHIRVFGGLNLLRIRQTLRTVFSDYAGSPPIFTQAYGLPADPDFYFQTKNSSQYQGIGPDLGVNIRLENNGVGLITQFSGALTAGSIHAVDHFRSASRRLMDNGIATSSQEITTPSSKEVVPALDSKLGLFYEHTWKNACDLTIEAGYRLAYYINAIAKINPDTLVQAGANIAIPEFATGTMAINSTTDSTTSFNVKGPYISIVMNF